jgi:hypothetical protein
MSFEKLTEIPGEAWPGLRFRFGPSLRRLSLRFDVAALWLGVNQKRVDQPPLKAEPYKSEWLVWRVGLEVRFRPLETEEAWALDRAMAGDDFASLCEGLCQWVEAERAAFGAAELIKSWFDSSLVEDAWVENLTPA